MNEVTGYAYMRRFRVLRLSSNLTVFFNGSKPPSPLARPPPLPLLLIELLLQELLEADPVPLADGNELLLFS